MIQYRIILSHACAIQFSNMFSRGAASNMASKTVKLFVNHSCPSARPCKLKMKQSGNESHILVTMQVV